MRHWIVCILLLCSTNTHASLSDRLEKHYVIGLGINLLIAKNILKCFSRPHNTPLRCICFSTIADSLFLFTGHFVISDAMDSFKEDAPDWLKPRTLSKCEFELAKLKSDCLKPLP